MNKLLSLLQLSDPTLPIGGYSHSAGLETYVQHGKVKDLKTAREYIEGMLMQNLRFTDGAFVSLAFDAALSNDMEEILLLDEECNAVKIPREIREASRKLGMRLMKIFQPLSKNNICSEYKGLVDSQIANGHYCIAFGLYAHAFGITKEEMLAGFFYNAAAGMVTNCVKLIPLGQLDGQQLLFSLQPVIDRLVKDCMHPDRWMMGLCCPGFDIRSMQHEHLYSRLYMS
jgi:urease accessory protein